MSLIRWRAARVAGVRPTTRLYHGADPFSEAVKLNVARRHLNASQIAAAVVKSGVLREASEAAKGRQGTRTDLAPGKGPSNFVPVPGQSAGRSTRIVAAEYGIGHTTLEEAQRVAREAPEMLPEIIIAPTAVNCPQIRPKVVP